MALLGKLGESRRRKLGEFLSERLDQGETLEATLPMTQTSASTGLGLLLAEISSWTPESGEILFAIPTHPRFYGIGVTNRNVHLVSWRSSVPERPDQVIATVPRSYVSVKEWKPPRLGSGKLVLGLRDKQLKVQVPSMHRDEAERLVAVIGEAAAR